MSGAEIAGLTLGVLPIIMAAVQKWDLLSIFSYSKFSHRANFILLGLRMQRTLFRNECRLLLKVGEEHQTVEAMLYQLHHPSWTDSELDRKLFFYLGDSREPLIDTISAIQEKLVGLEREAAKLEAYLSSEASKVSPATPPMHLTLQYM